QTVSGGQVFQAAVPAIWTTLSSKGSLKAVPQNGYGALNGQTVLTHGVEFGLAKAESNDLRAATSAWLKLIAQSNPEARIAGTRDVQVSQRPAIETTLTNPSPLGGQERVIVRTALLGEGALFYYLAIVPDKDAGAFQPAFQKIAESIRLTAQ